MKHLFIAAAMLFSISALAEEAYLNLSSYYDLENDRYDLEEPKEFKINKDFIEKYYVDFRIFTDDDIYPSLCFSGDSNEALQLIQAVLDVSTGDSFILESSLKVKGNVISHEGTFTEGSGDYDFDLSFDVPQCQ